MEAPPLILRITPILSGSKNQHSNIGTRLWRTSNTIETAAIQTHSPCQGPDNTIESIAAQQTSAGQCACNRNHRPANGGLSLKAARKRLVVSK
jgi:hypothetical protein